MVQWLRLHTPSAAGPGQGIRSHNLQLKILRAKTKTQHSQLNNQIKKIIKATSNSQPAAFPTYSVNSSAWNVRPSLSLTQCGWAWEGVWSVPVEQGRGYRGVWNCLFQELGSQSAQVTQVMLWTPCAQPSACLTLGVLLSHHEQVTYSSRAHFLFHVSC